MSALALLRLAVIGDGRMGRAVASLAQEHGFEVVALLGESQVMPLGITPALLDGAHVAIEFTVPAHAAANVRGCVAARCPVVSGTTGWDTERATVEAEVRSRNGALLWAPNFAIGVHVFARLVEYAAREIARANEQAARAVAEEHAGFDAQIVETHHRGKVDAPSGTARLLAQRVARGLGREPNVTSVRTGSVPGTHEVVFDAPFEQIRLEHVARDRSVFASGALVAARWLVGKHGVFTLGHVLGAAE